MLRSDFYYCQTVAGLLIWGTLSDERTGLSFTIAAGAHQRHIFLSPIRDFPFVASYSTLAESRYIPFARTSQKQTVVEVRLPSDCIATVAARTCRKQVM
jgi:hypothetical protein